MDNSYYSQQLLADTQKLVSLFYTNLRFKTAFEKIVAQNPKARYKGRPLIVYARVIYSWTKQQNLEQREKYRVFYEKCKDDISIIGSIFTQFYLDQTSGIKKLNQYLEEANNSPNLPVPAEIQQIAAQDATLQKEVKDSLRDQKYLQLVNTLDQNEKQGVTAKGLTGGSERGAPETARREVVTTEDISGAAKLTGPVKKAKTIISLPNLPKISIPIGVEIFIKKASSKIFTPGVLASLVSGVIGSLVVASGGPSSMLIGFTIGAVAPTIITKTGIGASLLNNISGGGEGSRQGSSSPTANLANNLTKNLARKALAATPAGRGIIIAKQAVPAALKYGISIAIGLLLLIIMPGMGGLLETTNPLRGYTGIGEAAPAESTPLFQALKLTKSASKSQVQQQENIEFKLAVNASYLTSSKIKISDHIPANTEFVSAENGGKLTGSTIEWDLEALKLAAGNRPIPPAGATVPQEFRKPIQRISVTKEQIKNELLALSPDYAKYADLVYSLGQKHNVDPAFIMAIWYMESAYNSVGGYTNNPGSIVYTSDGYLGMKKGQYSHDRYWATWDTFEQGLEAIPLLISKEYYLKGQTDAWSIHSGIGDKGEHAYHGRGDIGVGDIQNWDDYVRFYYSWLNVMDRISGGGEYSLNQSLSFKVKATSNDQLIANVASIFNPSSGTVNSDKVEVRVGNPVIQKKAGRVFFCEADPAWKTVCDSSSNYPYDLNQNGCGPTSMAIIAKSFGLDTDPIKMDSEFRKSGARTCRGSTSIQTLLSSGFLSANGFTTVPIGLKNNRLDLTEAKNYLDQGSLILGSAPQYPCPNSGWCKRSTTDHIFVVDGVDISNNKISVIDPINCYSNHLEEFETDRVKDNTFTWYWAYAIKR